MTGMQSIYGDIGGARIASVDQALFNLGLLEQKNEAALAGAEQYPTISFMPCGFGEYFYDRIILGNNF